MAELTRSEDLRGKTVANRDGHVIGEVTEIVVDPSTWRVTDLQVRVEKATAKEMGLKAPLFGSLLLLVETARVASTSDQIILDIAVDGFKDYVDGRKQAEKEAKKG